MRRRLDMAVSKVSEVLAREGIEAVKRMYPPQVRDESALVAMEAVIRAIDTRTFNTEKVGQINRREIFMLLRLEIDDGHWQRGMKAIRDAMRVEGSETYIRCFRRVEPWPKTGDGVISAPEIRDAA
tara:strand:- start:152 stop:529 length:378 start_codon:yes stop_codon:yes gene_type:complete